MDLYPLRKNRLRECLDQGWPSLGTHLLSTWPTITELVGQTGQFDYIEFVAEYAPWTMHDLDNLGRAIELFPNFSGMIKIEQFTRGHLAMRAIGSGIQNVLFADIRTADDAHQCVRSVRAEHPDQRGLHGVGLRRDARTVLHVGSKEWMAALAECVVALMIEKREALEDLDAILGTPGVDMVQFGPADYAMSIGLSRLEDAEQIREAEEHVIATALPPRGGAQGGDRRRPRCRVLPRPRGTSLLRRPRRGHPPQLVQRPGRADAVAVRRAGNWPG